MYYKKTIDFIHKRFNKDKRAMLIRYFHSELFQNDLEEFIFNQVSNGETITKELATECLLESYEERDREENNVILTDFEF